MFLGDTMDKYLCQKKEFGTAATGFSTLVDEPKTLERERIGLEAAVELVEEFLAGYRVYLKQWDKRFPLRAGEPEKKSDFYSILAGDPKNPANRTVGRMIFYKGSGRKDDYTELQLLLFDAFPGKILTPGEFFHAIIHSGIEGLRIPARRVRDGFYDLFMYESDYIRDQEFQQVPVFNRAYAMS